MFLPVLDDLGFHGVFLDDGRIDLVVVGVSSYEPDEDNRCVVVDLHDEAISVTLDIEDHPVAGQDIRRRVTALDVPRGFPCGGDGFMKPRLQGSLGIRVLFIEIAQGFPGDDSHDKGRSGHRRIKQNVPILGTLSIASSAALRTLLQG